MDTVSCVKMYIRRAVVLSLCLAGCKAGSHKGGGDEVVATPANNDVQVQPESTPRVFDWYIEHTAGERSARPVGTSVAPPPIATSFSNPVFPSVCVTDSEGSFERIQPLFCVPVPKPTATDIVDQQAAIRLGKALFWDVQVGGDGNTACASCHFNGGVDNRVLNTLHPGGDGIFASGRVTGPGQVFYRADIKNDDRVGSQGVVGGIFTSINTDIKVAKDNCANDFTRPFLTHRRVTGRKTPSVIGAVYNRFNFWDGRAHPTFNGFDPFGDTRNAEVAQALFTNGSLASQAVGPPNNSVEMSCSGRPFNGPGSLGEKLLSRPVLQFQQVAFSDSSLGDLSAWPNQGLTCFGRACTYSDLITAAFGTKWTDLAINNFSRIWGEALQAYMSTLIPDQTRMDQYLAGKKKLLTTQQIRGLDIFKGRGNCSKCHAGAELTDASVNYARLEAREDQGNDEGFHNLGLRPTAEDLGRGGVGPGNVPLSASQHDFDRGAFKTPGLRNLKLTAPYFHTGGKATLESVVSFYAHNGGDTPNPELSRELEDIRLAPADYAPLVDFLRDGLLDCRVEKQRAPFDHPSLPLPNGVPLAAIGLKGFGSCRLDAATPPTTLNCMNRPFACESDDALVGTSIFMDLTGNLPNIRDDLIAFRGASLKPMQVKILSLLTDSRFVSAEKSRFITQMMSMPVGDTSKFFKPSFRDTIIAVLASPAFYQANGSKIYTVSTRITQALAGRLPTATEATLATRNLSLLISNIYDSVEGRKKRAADYYKRFLRREATAAEITTWVNANNENNSIAGMLVSAEYRAFATARDDI